jgi:hypothetical protein
MNTVIRSQLLRSSVGRGQQFRFSSAAAAANNNDLVIGTVNETLGIAMLTMNRPPANSLSLEM